MAFKLSARDEERLKGVHGHLVRVLHRCATLPRAPRFMVIEGRRSKARQAELVAKGASWTMNSRHLTGHAVDIAPVLDTDGDGDIELSWHWPHFYPLSHAMFEAAQQERVPIEWGGNWSASRKDGPHWQLPKIGPYLTPVPYDGPHV
jgi:peptidoglycan L-alanyl-D-glutamate endopeptidase CwlK